MLFGTVESPGCCFDLWNPARSGDFGWTRSDEFGCCVCSCRIRHAAQVLIPLRNKRLVCFKVTTHSRRLAMQWCMTVPRRCGCLLSSIMYTFRLHRMRPRFLPYTSSASLLSRGIAATADYTTFLNDLTLMCKGIFTIIDRPAWFSFAGKKHCNIMYLKVPQN